ncbi:hypothetical protein GCM10023231_01970 [Olivibacter ginsenosidimutans]|uniref:Uncharacterized protein n=1 Tax=Olivibacter ginsenosidimutans TaxID=1176537 RepID=A0ABP9ADW4_9SPHI
MIKFRTLLKYCQKIKIIKNILNRTDCTNFSQKHWCALRLKDNKTIRPMLHGSSLIKQNAIIHVLIIIAFPKRKLPNKRA